MNREEYITALLEQIRYKRARSGVQKEISNHIDDQKDAFILEGMAAPEAEEKAVLEMGDPVDAGNALNRIHRPRTDWSLLLMVVGLAVFGIFVQSLLFPLVDNGPVRQTYLGKTIEYNIIGILLMVVVMFMDYSFLARYVWPIYGVYLLGCFAVVRYVGSSWGYARWFVIGGYLVMFFVPIFAAFIYRFRQEKWRGIIKTLLLGFVTLLLMTTVIGIYASGMLLAAVITCFILFMIAVGKGIYGGNRKIQLGIIGTVALLVVAFICLDLFSMGGSHILLADYQYMRIQAFLHPQQYQNGVAYTLVQARSMLQDIGMFQGNGMEKLMKLQTTLPGSYTDYIVTAAISYFGKLVGAVLLLYLFSFLVRMLYISIRQKNRLGSLLGVACSLLLAIKMLVYVGYNLGLLVAMSTDMPFLSFGMTNTLSNYFFLGLILCVYRNTELVSEPMKKKKEGKYKIQFDPVEFRFEILGK